MTNKRRQLTLFLKPTQSRVIEELRKTFNSIQYDLIKAHITLCREDEIAALDQVKENLSNLKFKEFKLSLKKLRRFEEGKGLLIDLEDPFDAFNHLRKRVLFKAVQVPRDHNPHITIMHPRNSTCSDAIYNIIKKADLPDEISISKISLIEQEIGNKWNILSDTFLIS